MGRGLSPLQTTILGLAYKSEMSFIRLYDVYEALYGWKRQPKHFVHPQGEYWLVVWDVEAATFNRRAAAVSRALRRLKARGLLTLRRKSKYFHRTRNTPWVLTTAGSRVARQLTVNQQGGGKAQLPLLINR